jgi:hypothetical protein
MTTNISGFGLQAQLVATYTFPFGVTINDFADDTDPADIPAVQIGDGAMGLNGELVVWTKAVRLDVNLSVIPTSQSDINLQILLDQNRAAQGKLVVPDIITLVLAYPAVNGGNTFYVTYTGGKIISGPPSNSVASSARFKTNTYGFIFEGKVVS